MGADVIGHYHVGIGDTPNTGETIEMDSNQGTWEVKLNTRANVDCYEQQSEDEIGCHIDVVLIRKIK